MPRLPEVSSRAAPLTPARVATVLDEPTTKVVVLRLDDVIVGILSS